MDHSKKEGKILHKKGDLTAGRDDAKLISADTVSSWDSALEMTSVRHRPGVQMMEDVQKAEDLVKTLGTRRLEQKKELSKSLKIMGDDVNAEIRSARKKARKKVKDKQLIPTEAVVEETSLIHEERNQASLPTTPNKESKGLTVLRAKLRSKLQSAKEKDDSEVREEPQQPQRVLKGRRDQPLAVTRFDETIIGRDALDTEEKAQSQETGSRWKKAAAKIKRECAPSREEQFDFFVNTFDDEDEEKRASAMKAGLRLETQRQPDVMRDAAKGVQGSAERAEGDENEDAQDEVRQHLIPKVDESEGVIWVMAGAEYTPSQQKIEAEEDAYFVPSVIEVPTEKKLAQNCVRRDLAEEGLYVGQRPLVSSKECNKMENRLLSEPDNKGRQWFGEDGRILSLPDPVKKTPSRPFVPEEPDPSLQTYYRQAVTKEFDSRYIDGSIQAEGKYRLDIDVNTVVFTHHELMSKEHVLASRLTMLMSQYQQRKAASAVEYLSEKIRALKSAIVHLKETIVKLNKETINVELGDGEHLKNLQQREKEYILELRDLRKACDAEEQSDRDLLKNIAKTWASLKQQRTFQNCINTALKLRFQRIPTDAQEDQKQLKEDIAKEVQEIKWEHSLSYQEEEEIYRRNTEKHRENKRFKKQAAARIKARQNRHAAADDDMVDLAQETEDQEIMMLPDFPKPHPPERFDESGARSRIEEKFKRIKRRPGEPKLIPEMSHSMNVTNSEHCPRGEMLRREAVQRCHLYTKVLFNNRPVARTDTRLLTQDFTVSFAQIIPIHIIQWPESISLQIYEAGLVKDRLVASMYAAIPGTTVTSESAELDKLEFASDQIRERNNEAVGSGVTIVFDDQGDDTQMLLTGGYLMTSVAWGVDSFGNPLVPMATGSNAIVRNAMNGNDVLVAIGASAAMDMEKLAKWISDSRLDPNDPENADLVYLLRPRGSGERMTASEYFRLEQLQEEFNFTTDEELAQDKRLRLLELREREVQEFRNMKMVPAFTEEIKPDVFKEYNERVDKENQVNKMDGLTQRDVVTRFMQRVRQQIMERKRLFAHQKSLQEIVIEESVPNIAGQLMFVVHKLAPRRRLRPRRKERKKVAGQNLQDREVKVVVHITRAYDVPCRIVEAGQQNQMPSSAELTSRVRPFFEVVFQRDKQCTTVAEGPNPSWNEELNLPFSAPNNDYSATNLQTVNDIVFINLFDEVVTDVLADDRQRGRVVHKRLDRKWLGGIQIPFATLYLNGVIEGTFRINSPAILLGYVRDDHKKGDMALGDTGAGHTYVSLFMTVEPPLGTAPEVKDQFDSNESAELLAAAASYMDHVESAFPTRSYATAVIDINGKTVFVTKYFRPLAPPETVLALPGDQMANVARFVSLIPYISDSVTFPGICDIWSTCDQFLQMLTGDEEEHAVLLTNYFLHLGKDAYLCIGMAIPEGVTAYTLVRDGNDTHFWSSTNGDKYSIGIFCPFQSVGCLINQHNIWANIQVSDSPSRMSFDVTNTKCWKPFFTSSFPNPGLPSVQPEKLIYFETNRDDVIKLQEELEQMLKDRFEKQWRPKDVTRWNRNYMPTFRSVLESLEENRSKDSSREHHQKFEGILKHYKLSGFTLNMPYLPNTEKVADAVYATGVWENDNPGVEFALAVHIHHYPNSVLSVWIYVASLQRLRV